MTSGEINKPTTDADQYLIFYFIKVQFNRYFSCFVFLFDGKDEIKLINSKAQYFF